MFNADYIGASADKTYQSANFQILRVHTAAIEIFTLAMEMRQKHESNFTVMNFLLVDLKLTSVIIVLQIVIDVHDCCTRSKSLCEQISIYEWDYL